MPRLLRLFPRLPPLRQIDDTCLVLVDTESAYDLSTVADLIRNVCANSQMSTGEAVTVQMATDTKSVVVLNQPGAVPSSDVDAKLDRLVEDLPGAASVPLWRVDLKEIRRFCAEEGIHKLEEFVSYLHLPDARCHMKHGTLIRSLEALRGDWMRGYVMTQIPSVAYHDLSHAPEETTGVNTRDSDQAITTLIAAIKEKDIKANLSVLDLTELRRVCTEELLHDWTELMMHIGKQPQSVPGLSKRMQHGTRVRLYMMVGSVIGEYRRKKCRRSWIIGVIIGSIVLILVFVGYALYKTA